MLINSRYVGVRPSTRLIPQLGETVVNFTYLHHVTRVKPKLQPVITTPIRLRLNPHLVHRSNQGLVAHGVRNFQHPKVQLLLQLPSWPVEMPSKQLRRHQSHQSPKRTPLLFRKHLSPDGCHGEV